MSSTVPGLAQRCTPAVVPSRSRIGVTLGVTDVTVYQAGLSVDAAACADVETWVLTAAGWMNVAGADAVDPRRRRWEQFKAKHMDLQGQALLEQEAVFLDSPHARVFPTAGRDGLLHPSGGLVAGSPGWWWLPTVPA